MIHIFVSSSCAIQCNLNNMSKRILTEWMNPTPSAHFSCFYSHLLLFTKIILSVYVRMKQDNPWRCLEIHTYFSFAESIIFILRRLHLHHTRKYVESSGIDKNIIILIWYPYLDDGSIYRSNLLSRRAQCTQTRNNNNIMIIFRQLPHVYGGAR